MMESELNNDEIGKRSRELAENAMSVYSFISELPFPFAQFVYKTIIDDAIKTSFFLSPQDGINQFVDAACDYLYEEADTSPLLKCLGMSDSQDEFDSAIASPENRKNIVKEHKKIMHLPQPEDFLAIMSCFIPERLGKKGKEIIFDSILNKLLNAPLCENPIMKDSNASTICSHFDYLGYLTMLHNWYADPEWKADKDSLFISWYCEGRLLDFVLDAVYKCGVTSVSIDLWDHICRACYSDYRLANLFNSRYDGLRKFYHFNDFAPFESEKREEPSEEETNGYAMSLPKISKIEGYGCYTGPEVTRIYQYLLDSECIDDQTTMPDFLNAFGGEGRRVKKIVWKSEQKKLATYLYVFNGSKTDKHYAEQAAKLFLQRNGKQCKALTLNQPEYDEAGKIKDALSKLFE